MAGCSSDPVTSINFDNGTFRVEEGVSDTVHTLNTGHDILLAGTTSGAYKKNIADRRSGWNHIGLQIDSSTVNDFIIHNSSLYMAAVLYDGQSDGRPVLFKTENSGNSWNDISVTYDQELRYFQVLELEANLEIEDHLFADAGGTVMESSDGGYSWSNIYSGTFSFFLHLSEYHTQQLWVGGVTNIFSPYLAKSEDGGQNWTLLNENFTSGFSTETNLYDVILHPNDPNQVLVGAGGAIAPANVIRKSTDSGKSWQTVIEGINTRTLTHSARNPKIVYASGIKESGSLFFAASEDFGESWETIEWEDSPAGMQVNDMVSVMEDGREVLYFGTNKGVFSYRFSE